MAEAFTPLLPSPPSWPLRPSLFEFEPHPPLAPCQPESNPPKAPPPPLDPFIPSWLLFEFQSDPIPPFPPAPPCRIPLPTNPEPAPPTLFVVLLSQ